MCGLIGVIGTPDAASQVFLGLMNLQHRGQDGAGLLTVSGFHHGDFHLQKGSGLVENIFSERSFKNLRGNVALGHTRYATIGRKDPNLLQPFLDFQAGIGIAHNGNIVNCYEITRDLSERQHAQMPDTESDSEVLLKLIAAEMHGAEPGGESLFNAIGRVMEVLVGSYAVVGIDREGGLFGFRDPHGIRPLVIGEKDTEDGQRAYAMASESVALDYLGYTNINEIEPGEAVYVDSGSHLWRRVLKQESYSPCMFEWVYFARVESQIGSLSVYHARFQLGVLLAEHLRGLGVEADVVVPVPETSRVAAIAIAETLGLPFRELLIKNRYVNRTFILDGQEERQKAIRRKLFPVAAELEGKRCLVVDDSIVRGNTASQIIQLMRQAGAREVTLVSTCPPIRTPCYYGIDFPSQSELVASERDEAAVAAHLGADRVIYQTMEGLVGALKQRSICSGCLTGIYPTDVSSGREFEERRVRDREKRTVKA